MNTTESTSITGFYENSTEWILTTPFQNVSNGSIIVAEDKKSQGYVGMIIAMFILAILLNSAAIYSIVKSSKHHKWSAFYRLLLCLTITDSLGTVTCFPVLLVTYAHGLVWQGGQPSCDYLGFMISFVFLSSASFVCAMSLERFLGVWAPFLYSDNVTRENRTLALTITIWGIAFVLALCPVFGFGDYVIQYPGSWCFYNFRAEGISKAYAYIYSVLWLLVISCTVIFNVMVIIKLVKRVVDQRKKTRAKDGEKKRTNKATRNEMFSMVLLGVIVLVTMICGIPLAVRAIANESGYEKNNKADLHASRMATFNMILDPLVYILFRRENLERIFKFIRKRKRGTGSDPGSSSDKMADTDTTNNTSGSGNRL